MKACLVVAEDDRAIFRLLSETWVLRDYQVLPVRNGDPAWQTIREDEPAVARLNLRMPGLDGLEVTRRLRADPETQEIGAIILTADRRHRDDALRAGAGAFLDKPFSPRERRDQVGAIERRQNVSRACFTVNAQTLPLELISYPGGGE